MDPTTSKRAGEIDSTLFDRLLHTHVRHGQVDYQGLRRQRADLQLFLDDLAQLAPDRFPVNEERLAWWLNAYNAVNLQGVLDYWPLPSVKQVPGFFNRIRYRVGGRWLTIDQIERQARAFHEYRVHFALTCASAGAPWLRAEAYEARRLEGQLDEQAREFVADPQRGVRLDESRGEIWLSKIFHWSSPDMIGSRLPNVVVAPCIPGTILETVARSVDQQTRKTLRARRWRIRYLPYDWSLNGPKYANSL